MTDQYMSGERQVDGNEMENISKYSSPEQNEHCQKKIYQSGNVKADSYVDRKTFATCHIMNQKRIHECRGQIAQPSLCLFRR